jgi:transposase InsO family protein
VKGDGIVKERLGGESLSIHLKERWPEDRPHLGIAEVADWFASYVYLPKLRDRLVLEGAIRLRPERPGHVWSYDFVEDITWNGRKYRMLNIVDEFSRECLAMVPQRHFRSDDVLAILADLFIEHGPPEHIRSDNGTEFAAKAVKEWLGRVGVKTLFIEPGSPWENVVLGGQS